VTGPAERHPEASMARMIRRAVEAALAPEADDESLHTARSAAQIVGLPGLDACLALLGERHGARLSPALATMVEQLRGITAAETLSGIRAADGRMAALAVEASEETRLVVGGTPADQPTLGYQDLLGPEASGEPTLSVAEALDEMPLAGDNAEWIADRTRLTVHVAAALRAALEWLTRDAAHARPFRLRAEDSLLEVTCDSINPQGLVPAHEVLAAADGSLAPVGETSLRAAAGAWTVRVPAWSERPVYLMFEQGPLRLALPWHSVLRLSLVPSIEIEMRGGQLATPVLRPLAPLAEGVGERPVVAIAHGLKRGLLVADRLVWRLAAESADPEEPAPDPSLHRVVISEEGDLFWVAEPRVLLHGLPMPRLPDARPETRPEPPRDTAPPETPTEAPPTLTPQVPAETDPIVLDSDDVEPMGAMAAEVPVVVALTPADVLTPAVATPPTVVTPPAVVTPQVAATLEPAPTPAPPIVRIETPPAAVQTPAEPALLPAWLERFGSTPRVAAPVEPVVIASPAGFEPASPPSAPAPEAPGARAVLIAEDSIAAGRFLARLFEQAGFTPHVVESAAALRASLASGRWTMVCIDVELPDSRGAEQLAALATTLVAAHVPCIALVRDDEDADVARAAGVRRWLRKPFDREELLHLLRATGLAERESA
jgi:CheY-like chemotaxis protein